MYSSCVLRNTVKSTVARMDSITIRGMVRLTFKDTVRATMRITVEGMLRITENCMVIITENCMVIITVKGTATHSYLYPLCAPVTLLRPTNNRAVYRRCLHSNVSRHVRVERLTSNRQLFLIVPSSPHHLKLAILSVIYLCNV